MMPELKTVFFGPAHYDSSAPVITTLKGLNYYSLIKFVESSVCPGGIVYQLGVGTSASNAIYYYWDSSHTAWSISDGSVLQANSASAIQANLSRFASQLGAGKLFLKAHLQSSGTSACILSNIEIDGLQ